MCTRPMWVPTVPTHNLNMICGSISLIYGECTDNNSLFNYTVLRNGPSPNSYGARPHARHLACASPPKYSYDTIIRGFIPSEPNLKLLLTSNRVILYSAMPLP